MNFCPGSCLLRAVLVFWRWACLVRWLLHSFAEKVIFCLGNTPMRSTDSRRRQQGMRHDYFSLWPPNHFINFRQSSAISCLGLFVFHWHSHVHRKSRYFRGWSVRQIEPVRTSTPPADSSRRLFFLSWFSQRHSVGGKVHRLSYTGVYIITAKNVHTTAASILLLLLAASNLDREFHGVAQWTHRQHREGAGDYDFG